MTKLPARKEVIRCPWAKGELDQQYHDAEWGVPVHDDRLLFELLMLEGAQAGLSWSTILKKRANYQKTFQQFDPAVVAKFGPKQEAALMQNEGIVRNRLKVASAAINAQAFLQVQAEFGSFDAFIWTFVDGQPLQNKRTAMSEVPARTEQSDAMSKALKKRGFKFIGTTICYAFMQATGMVNDHLVSCFRHKPVQALGNCRRQSRGSSFAGGGTLSSTSCINQMSRASSTLK
ncbi:DNA-3-methyladenine glycosylase 1 [Anatilimnocola aggregata]|uniref:DNA-3-methyladenine glycosylase I n=1 Tax=Anatilimnocola aggregata TaxID=2528021 RepID=A0A517YKY7_9BACT|nr:DNA-3-methyladenine glycosylase I [Anatilimnocola aggregata]QDU30895.1 DNA-3-methyladenine glycosylase 1 [Anatilimnocola aggregata]